MKKLLLVGVSVAMLSGCGPKVVLVQPAYYQEGHYKSTSYQPDYYDVYGNLHTQQDRLATYQPPRLHRETYHTAYSSTSSSSFTEQWLTTPVLMGAVGGAAVAATVDGGLSALLLGTVAGAYAGKTAAEHIQ